MLSTGEIRKVLVAATLSQSPRVLVLDKPFDGLDAPSRYASKPEDLQFDFCSGG